MRKIWKTQSKISACTLNGRSVAVRSWDKGSNDWTYQIVRVSEVSPSGLEFASFDGFTWEGFDVADIVRVF